MKGNVAKVKGEIIFRWWVYGWYLFSSLYFLVLWQRLIVEHEYLVFLSSYDIELLILPEHMTIWN